MFAGVNADTRGIFSSNFWEILGNNFWEILVISVIISAITALFIHIVIFFITHTFWSWYWKIGKRTALMEEQTELLKKLITTNENLVNVIEQLMPKEINKGNNEKCSDNNKINILL